VVIWFFVILEIERTKAVFVSLIKGRALIKTPLFTTKERVWISKLITEIIRALTGNICKLVLKDSEASLEKMLKVNAI